MVDTGYKWRLLVKLDTSAALLLYSVLLSLSGLDCRLASSEHSNKDYGEISNMWKLFKGGFLFGNGRPAGRIGFVSFSLISIQLKPKLSADFLSQTF